MIAPSVMNLTAPPAFADHCIRMIDDGAGAIVIDPEEPGPVVEALDARRLEVTTILMTPDRRAAVGNADRSRFPSSRPRGDVIASTGGHTAYLRGVTSGAPSFFRGDTMPSTRPDMLLDGAVRAARQPTLRSNEFR
jgi:hypothetical protein